MREVGPPCIDCDETKGLGPSISGGGKKRRILPGIGGPGKGTPDVVPFDSDADDGDSDGMVQDGTVHQRPSLPQRLIERVANFRNKLKTRTIVEDDGVEQKMVSPPRHLRNVLPDKKTDFTKIRARDADFREKLATILEQMSEAHDPEVDKAYRSLANEIKKQFDMLPDLGISVEFVEDDPYPDIFDMIRDINQGKLKVLKTSVTGPHPYFSDQENDWFRAVHDTFGHAATGRGFDRHGEEAAYQAHKTMFPESLHPILASELRAQTAYLIQRGKFLDKQVGGFIPMELTKRLHGLILYFKAAPRVTADNDNLYDVGRSHHASCGRHFSADGLSGKRTKTTSSSVQPQVRRIIWNDFGLSFSALKALGPSLGGAAHNVPKPAAFDPNAHDGDGDGKEQDGTIHERLSDDAIEAVAEVASQAKDLNASKLRKHFSYTVARYQIRRSPFRRQEIERDLEGYESKRKKLIKERDAALAKGKTYSAVSLQAFIDFSDKRYDRRQEYWLGQRLAHSAETRDAWVEARWRNISIEEFERRRDIAGTPGGVDAEIRRLRAERDQHLAAGDAIAAARVQADLQRWEDERSATIRAHIRAHVVDDNGKAYRFPGGGIWFEGNLDEMIENNPGSRAVEVLEMMHMPKRPLLLQNPGERDHLHQFITKYLKDHADHEWSDEDRRRIADIETNLKKFGPGSTTADWEAEERAEQALDLLTWIELSRQATLTRQTETELDERITGYVNRNHTLAELLEQMDRDGQISSYQVGRRGDPTSGIFAVDESGVKETSVTRAQPDHEFYDEDFLNEHFNQYMPEGYRIEVISMDYEDFDGADYTVGFHILNENEEVVGRSERRFRPDDGVVIAELLDLDDEVEGSGIAAAHYRALAELAEEYGMSEIHVHANISVGGYAWGRYGYVPDDSGIIEHFGDRPYQVQIRGGPDDGKTLDPLQDYIDELMRDPMLAGRLSFAEARKHALDEFHAFVADCSDRFRMGDIQGWYDFVDSRWGKAALLRTDWYGRLDLGDPEQRSRFFEYVMPRTRHRVGEKALKRQGRRTKASPKKQRARKPFTLSDAQKRRMKAEPRDRNGKDAWIHAEMLRDRSLRADFDLVGKRRP